MTSRLRSLRSAAGLGFVALAVAAASCSGDGDGSGGGVRLGGAVGTLAGELQGTGSVGMALTIGNGVHVNSLNWTIANATNTYTGTVNITDDAGNEAQSIEFVAGGVLAGSGYVVTLSGADSSGDPCTGASTPLSVTAGTTTATTVLVTCTIPTDASLAAAIDSGSIAVDAGVVLVDQPPFVCPALTGVGISPAEVRPPELASVNATTTSGAGGTPTLLWTSTCGTFANPTQANTTFSCGATTGSCTVTVTVGLNGTGLDGGSVGQVCSGVANTSTSEVIVCEAQCNTAADCPVSTACVVPSCTANRCSTTSTAQGTQCSDSGGSICDGAGTCVVPSFDVVRLGNGSAVTAGVTVPVFIDQYSTTGTLMASTALPTAVSGSNQPLTLVGSEVSEGDLTTSVNGKLLVLAGHNYAPGATVSAADTGVAFIGSGPTPTVNTSLELPLALSAGGLVRSAVSLDGTQVWVAGAGTGTTGGLWYMPGDVQVVKTSTTTTGRDLRISGGQLYADSNATPPGLFTVGSGEPITGSPAPTLTELPGLPTSGSGSPYAFVFLTVNGVQTLYIADDNGGGVGGVLKYTLSGTTWSKSTVGSVPGIAPSTPDAGTATAGYRGLAGYVTGGTVTLMASSGRAAGGQDELVVIVDTGSGTPSQTMIAISAPNETFRGVAIPPHP
jgi:hypothetical protein